MTLLQGLILAVVQGLTEFLPVSSSGHLVIAQKLLGFATPPISFDILVHSATLLAIIWFLRSSLLKLLRQNLLLVLIGSLPAGLIGLMLQPYLQIIFNSLSLVGIGLLFTGLILLATKSARSGSSLSIKSALLVGTAQALAILPGISRSGSTIATALILGVARPAALNFSLLLAIPAILGAQIIEFKDLFNHGNSLSVNALGFLVAFFSGILALKLIKAALASHHFHRFGYYCLAVGALVLLSQVIWLKR